MELSAGGREGLNPEQHVLRPAVGELAGARSPAVVWVAGSLLTPDKGRGPRAAPYSSGSLSSEGEVSSFRAATHASAQIAARFIDNANTAPENAVAIPRAMYG